MATSKLSSILKLPTLVAFLMSYVVSSVVIKMIRKIDLRLFRMGFLGAAGGGGEKAAPTKNLSHMMNFGTHDEFWYSCTLTKEDPKNI